MFPGRERSATGATLKPGSAAAVYLVLALTAGCGPGERDRSQRLRLELGRDRLPADGFASTEIRARNAAGQLVAAEFMVVEGRRVATISGSRVESTVNPGTATVEVRHQGAKAGKVTIITTPVYADRAADGTPDFLRLDDPGDRDAFRSSFTYLAEVQYFRSPEQLPPEITDCSALIRYAYRETFREHDREWAKAVRIGNSSGPAQPEKYFYPYTPLGAKLFRNVPGPFRETDLHDTAFSEFADAESIRRFNTHFISRDIGKARRGDLLFYRQPDQRSPAHAMIFMAESLLDGTPEKRVVYHTGPIGRDKGEIRRPAVEELLAHPQPQWRPLPGNSNFLGVYRWNILRLGS
jgi:uncharacterized protein